MIPEIFQFNDQVLGLKDQDRPLQPLTFKDGEHEFMLKALNEEIAEYTEGFEKQDIVTMVDSLLDLCYFAIGGLRRMGLTQNEACSCFLAIHLANMTKKKGTNAKRGDFADDAVKPESFRPPDEVIRNLLLRNKA